MERCVPVSIESVLASILTNSHSTMLMSLHCAPSHIELSVRADFALGRPMRLGSRLLHLQGTCKHSSERDLCANSPLGSLKNLFRHALSPIHGNIIIGITSLSTLSRSHASFS